MRSFAEEVFMKLNPEHIEEVLKLINQGPYFRLLNIDILSLEKALHR